MKERTDLQEKSNMLRSLYEQNMQKTETWQKKKCWLQKKPIMLFRSGA